MSRSQFSHKELGIPTRTFVTFDYKDTKDVYGRFTNTDGEIEVFINDKSFGEHTISGATKMVMKKMRLSDLGKFDGPKYWKLGDVSLKDYRVTQRSTQAAGFTREQLEYFYANSTGRLPEGWLK